MCERVPDSKCDSMRCTRVDRQLLEEEEESRVPQLDDRVALYWFNLGVVLEDQGRSAEAIGAYERALAIDSLMADAHYNLARQIELVARKAGDEIMLFRAVRHLKQYRELSRALG